MSIYKTKKRKCLVGILLVFFAGLLICSEFFASLFGTGALKEAFAVPYFARKYNVNCNSCHVIPPLLNQFGENFVTNGYTMPNSEYSRKTWPFALWLTQRGEAQYSNDIDKTFPNKVELISGGRIGNSPVSYFLEWRILSQQIRSDGSLKDRSGRFEDLFLTYAVTNSINIRAGQYRLLNQIDDSRKLGLSSPLVISAKIPGSGGSNARKTSLRAFAPNGRSPSVSLQHQSMPGVNAADGWFNIVSLVFPGELSIPLTGEARDEASFEFESDPKGVFLESFYRKGLGSLGAHVFLDDDRSLGSLIGVYNRGRWFSKLGLGFGRFDGDTNGRFTWENEFIPFDFFSVGARFDYQTEVDNGTSFVTNVNLQWPRTLWTLRLVLEQRIRSDNHATLAELSAIF
ncbi:hypothetical protein IIA28_18240 [candidate division KSB1 bacterium]|nr:hypothetical protein [candidate division KSB1 bacterium]